MNLDQKTYAQIHVAVRKAAQKYGFDAHTIEDITQEAALALVKALSDETKYQQIRNLKAYTSTIIVRKVADHYRQLKRKEFDANDVEWLTETIEASVDTLLDNQAQAPATIIDDYLSRYPKSFTKQNHRLWEIFKHQEYTSQEMMQLMGMTNPDSFYMAKTRLLAKIADIYTKIKASDTSRTT